MNVERLHTIARALKAEIDATGVVGQLQQLTTHFENLVNQPQAPEYQQGVASVLTDLRRDLPHVPSEDFSPSWRQTVQDLGIPDVLGAELLSSIESSIDRNQITPSIARDEIRAVSERVQELHTRLSELISALEFFQVPTEDLEPGEVEFSVLIPRGAVDNDLPDLGKELITIQGIVGPFLELATGSRPDLKVRSIASSDFGVYLDMAPTAAAMLALATERIVALYRNFLDIRLKHQELADNDVPAEVIAPLGKYASEAIEKGIAEEVERMFAGMTDQVDGRINELRIEMTNSLKSIAKRIDQGYNFDVRAEPLPTDDEDPDGEGGPPPPPSELHVAVNEIRSASAGLKFIAPAGKPILSLTEDASQPVDPKPKKSTEAKPRASRPKPDDR